MKKTWILLLILCGFAMAQRPYNNQRSGYAQNILWRDLHPSTQDSIRAAIIDSITALSADGVTILNDGTFKQKVINSTDLLSTIAADSNGMEIIVKQVAETGVGAGKFLWFSSGYTADTVLVFAGSSGYWVREEYHYNYIKPEWAGAKADNSTDNSVPLQAVIDIAKNNNYNKTILLENGKYLYSTELDLDMLNPVPTSTNRRGLAIVGAGPGKTWLKSSGCVGLRFDQPGSNRHHSIYLSGITIEGTAKADTGLIIRETTGAILNDVQIDSFFVGMYVFNTEGITATNLKLYNNAYGLKQYSNSNGNTYIGLHQGVNDSIGVYAESGQGLVFKGIDCGNQRINFEFGVAVKAAMEDGNLESCDSAHVIVGNGAQLTMKNIRVLEQDLDYWAYVNGAGVLMLSHTTWGGASNPKIYQNGTSARVYGDTYTQRVTNTYEFTHSTYGVIPVTPWEKEPAYQNPTDLTYYRGRLVHLFRRLGLGDIWTDRLAFEMLLDDTTSTLSMLTDGNDWRFTTNGNINNNALRVDRFRSYQGYTSVTSSAGDSTEVTVYTDTLGVDAFKYVSAPVIQKVSGSPIIGAYGVLKSVSTTTGAITYIIWHPNDTAGGLDLRLWYDATVQAKVTGKW